MAPVSNGTERFFNLPPKERALIAIGILFDGRDAIDVFLTDDEAGRGVLAKVAEEISEIPVQVRNPLLSAALREAVVELYSPKSTVKFGG